VKDDTMRRSTGKTLSEWALVIRDHGMGERAHKDIADFLHAEHGVSYWWAQEVTVEYERSVGRRVPGQTADGTFQVGVSRTITTSPTDLWSLLNSPTGIAQLLSQDQAGSAAAGDFGALASLAATTTEGLVVRTTTFVQESHVRLQWKMPGWIAHSVLEIRVGSAPRNRAVLTFHHEKLPSADARELMRNRWKALADRIAELLEHHGDQE
jgi:uncharacterized protein YndB with AHSA1/START domain